MHIGEYRGFGIHHSQFLYKLQILLPDYLGVGALLQDKPIPVPQQANHKEVHEARRLGDVFYYHTDDIHH